MSGETFECKGRSPFGRLGRKRDLVEENVRSRRQMAIPGLVALLIAPIYALTIGRTSEGIVNISLVIGGWLRSSFRSGFIKSDCGSSLTKPMCASVD